jgi:hypothetical protein
MSFPEVTPGTIDAEVETSSNILLEANALVNGTRAKQYGDPATNWINTAEIASALLGKKIEPEEAVLFAIAMKLARLRQDPAHHDSVVDLAGYAWVFDKVVKR